MEEKETPRPKKLQSKVALGSRPRYAIGSSVASSDKKTDKAYRETSTGKRKGNDGITLTIILGSDISSLASNLFFPHFLYFFFSLYAFFPSNFNTFPRRRGIYI